MHNSPVAVVDVEHGDLVLAHLLNLGSVPLLVHELGRTDLAWGKQMCYSMAITL